jgi:aspartate carbamoyltransferase catalytic subunit
LNKHLLSAGDLTAGDITRVLDTAAHLAKVTDRAIKKVPTLRGRTVCNLFFEDSTRTRISFELAAKRLSADVINFSAKGSSVSKGESLKDTAITLEAMGVDAIVMRHGASGAPWRLAEWVEAVVVNAGDGTHEHPTQALLDLYTMRQRFPGFDGLKVTLVAPPTLLPARVETWGAAVSYDLDAVLPKQDVVMMLRVQLERQRAGFFPSLREYARLYGLDGRRLDAMADHAIVMHPGPMNRGVEIAAEVADSLERSVIADQVANGISVRMALLYLLLGGPTEGLGEPRGGSPMDRVVA